MHPQERAAKIKLWKQSTMLMFRSNFMGEQRPQPPSIVQVSIPFSSNRRRDPHNYCGTVLKAIIDGLVQGGAWPDDTPEWVGHREPILYKGNQVVIAWTPVNAGDSRLV